MKNDNTTKLKTDIINNNVVFFCGSGISFGSNILSFKELLEIIWTVLFEKFKDIDKNTVLCSFNIDSINISQNIPLNKNTINRLKYISDNFQPELFLSILKELTQSDNVIQIWKCVNDKFFETTLNNTQLSNFKPFPNLIHYLIVYYSYISKNPILTVNYDNMLERAAANMKVDFECFKWNDTPPTFNKNKIQIIKLHGDSAWTNNKPLKSEDILCTLNQLSKTYLNWENYITKLADNKSICFLGYSGRDADYYPLFNKISYSNENSSFYWCLKIPKENNIDAAKKATYDNALRLNNCKIINKYPNEFFENLFKNVDDNYQQSIISFKKLCTCSLKEDQILNKNYISKAIHDWYKNLNINFVNNKNLYNTLWITLLSRIGNNITLYHELISNNKYTTKTKAKHNDNWIYYITREKVRCYREIANFTCYKKSAKDLIKWSLKNNKKFEIQWLTGKLENVSADYMMIPANLHYQIKNQWKWAIKAVKVYILFCILLNNFKKAKQLNKQGIEVLSQEAALRFCAFKLRLFSTFKQNRLLEKTRSNVTTLLYEAEKIGNIATMNGAWHYINKYKINLNLVKSYQTKVNSLKIISNDYTWKRRINDNTKAIIKYSVQSGNVLDVVKNILLLNKQQGFLQETYKQILKYSVSLITPKKLQNAIKKIIIDNKILNNKELN